MKRKWMLRIAAGACILCLAGGMTVACQKVELPSEEEEGTGTADPEEEVPEGQEPVQDGGETSGEDGGPDNPQVPYGPGYEGLLTVGDFLAIYRDVNLDSTEYNAQVAGYIVGVCQRSLENAFFEAEAIRTSEVKSNLLIADDKDERDVSRCIPVELKSGSEVRYELNLIDHPELLGRRIHVIGVAMTYFGVPGLRNLFDDADVLPDGPDLPEEPEEPDEPQEPEVPEEPEEPEEPEIPEADRDTVGTDDTPEIIGGGRSI